MHLHSAESVSKPLLLYFFHLLAFHPLSTHVPENVIDPKGNKANNHRDIFHIIYAGHYPQNNQDDALAAYANAFHYSVAVILISA